LSTDDRDFQDFAVFKGTPHRNVHAAWQQCTEPSLNLEAQTLISTTADALGGFPPSAAVSAVPLWRYNYLHNYQGPEFSRGPLFLRGLSRSAVQDLFGFFQIQESHLLADFEAEALAGKGGQFFRLPRLVELGLAERTERSLAGKGDGC
jgi:hypothetical protein